MCVRLAHLTVGGKEPELGHQAALPQQYVHARRHSLAPFCRTERWGKILRRINKKINSNNQETMREGGDVKATFRNKKTKSISLFVWKENEKSNNKKEGKREEKGKSMK